MIAIQESSLEQCHLDFLDICFSDYPLDQISNKISQKMTGYGTNINEKIQSVSDFIALLNLQREESVGIDMKFFLFPVSKTILSKGTAAVFVDEGAIKMTIEGKQLELFLRISSVYEFENDQWLAVHFHGSIPQGEEGDRDTWTVNEWKQKNDKLEKIIEERTNELRESLEHLKATQSQLIHSEKMASLGELTAGIAHEIQNPLNFVNNFSELSNELIDEMNEEINKGDIEEAKFIARDIKENLKKINHHGKRADAIVKGMLQHSRAEKGEKAPTDINALAEEYLKLSYHGLRAKDRSFNADFKTAFDPNLPKVDVVPQDIGRVLLNLINNAFYACTERSRSAVDEKKTLRQVQGDNNYEPTVWLSTKGIDKGVEITVRDNGNGIPQKVLDKIFQPFFTTKPTGQGTGLGLSLSYDIIKAHGGDIQVESDEGLGTTFKVILPKKES